jgi:glycerophosphoryl diester phosphodiesterase
MEAFAQAVALGADALEFDVHVTADGIPVVHHDLTLDRTTDGTGRLAARTRAEVRTWTPGARWTADGGASFPYRGRAITIRPWRGAGWIPADATRPRDQGDGGCPGGADGAPPAWRARTGRGRCVRSSIARADAGSGVALGASRSGVVRLLAAAAFGRVRTVPYQALFVPPAFNGLPLPVRRFARVLRPLGVPVHVWTVNDAVAARALWLAGVCGIVTDDPGGIQAARPAT